MNILNSKEAFDAMMAGRNIMCRAVGESMDFDDLSQFPATIFAMPGYEFCIKVETMELAGITFAKPLTLDDVVEDQDIYIVYPDHISQIKFSRQCSEHFACVRNGFAQLDQENAVLQLEALGELFGRVICYPPVIDNAPKTKKKRSARAKNDSAQVDTPAGPSNAVPNIEKQPEPDNETVDRSEWPASQVPSQNYIDMWLNRAKDEPTRRNLDGMKASIDHNWDNLDLDHQLQARQIYADFEALVEQAESEAIETDPVKLVEKFTAQISQFTKVDDVLSFRHVFLANGYLDQKDQQHLCKLTEDKLLELNPEQYMPKVEQPSENLSVTELQRLQHEAEKLVQNKGQDEEYQSLLTDLMDRASKANTPAEANALVGYTKTWTEEQRKPLIDAIHKRLVELNKADAQPSLAVRIQRAEDLTELDALEIDVSACDEVIQPRLMELIEQRRIQLDQIPATSEAQ